MIIYTRTENTSVGKLLQINLIIKINNNPILNLIHNFSKIAYFVSFVMINSEFSGNIATD